MNSILLSEMLGDFELPSIEVKLKTIEVMSKAGLKMLPACGIVNGKGTCGRAGETSATSGKHPSYGVRLTDYSGDMSALAVYFKANPNENVAVHCSGSSIVVIDIDPRSGGYASWKAFCEGNSIEIPKTVEVVTGAGAEGAETRGTHIYLRCPETSSLIGNLEKFGFPGVDIKHNGYVIAPSSMHKSGFVYAFKPGLAPTEVPIADIPLSLLRLIERPVSSISIPEVTYPQGALSYLESSDFKSSPYGIAALEGELSKVKAVREGNRNNTLFAVGLRLSALVAGGELNFRETREALVNAALDTGLEMEEIESVLSRQDGAFERGALRPVTKVMVDDSLKSWAEFSNASWGLEAEGSNPKDEFLKRANVVNLAEIFENTVEEDWLVPGFICAKRGHTLLSSAGLGKSLLMREVAAKLALGEPIIGESPVTPRRVLYIDFENDPVYDIGRSLAEMGLAMPEAFGDRLTFLSYPEFDSFDSLQGELDLEMAVNIFAPDLVVIDTLSRVISGEENSNDTWIKFYRHAGLLLKRLGVAYVRIDHLGKNLDAGARGGSAKSGDVDLIWTLESNSGSKDEFKLVNSKSRVPIKEKTLHLRRLAEPLRHVFVALTELPIDYATLSTKALGYVQLVESLAQDKFENKLQGQKKTWAAVADKCEEIGLTKRKYEEIHKLVKSSELEGEELLIFVLQSGLKSDN